MYEKNLQKEKDVNLLFQVHGEMVGGEVEGHQEGGGDLIMGHNPNHSNKSTNHKNANKGHPLSNSNKVMFVSYYLKPPILTSTIPNSFKVGNCCLIINIPILSIR